MGKIAAMGAGIILAGLLSACASRHSYQDTDIDALLWSTASAEYDVIARQIFSQAKRQLAKLIESPATAALEQDPEQSRHLPLAVIVDVDDTLLSNGQYHYGLLAAGKRFDKESWGAWIDQAQARAIAGSLEYTQFAAEKGVRVFYVSNRDVAHLDGTRRNLQQLGFPVDEDGSNLLLLNGAEGWSWDKGSRRAYIAKNYRVLQIIGDGLGDFMSGTSSMSLAEQRRASAHYMSHWGERWFMLPNPVYGDWESAILKGEDMTPSPSLDPLRAKYRFIRGGGESQGVW
jgi:acid phosphatase